MIGSSNFLINIVQFDFNSVVGGLAASGNIYDSSISNKALPLIVFFDNLNPVFNWGKYITDPSFLDDSFDNVCISEDGSYVMAMTRNYLYLVLFETSNGVI